MLDVNICESILAYVNWTMSWYTYRHSLIVDNVWIFQAEVMAVTLFSTPESGIIIQDSFSLSQLHDRLVCLQVPYFYFTKKVNE